MIIELNKDEYYDLMSVFAYAKERIDELECNTLIEEETRLYHAQYKRAIDIENRLYWEFHKDDC